MLISYLNEHEDAEQTAHWVREAGRRPVLMPGDISEQGHCREIVQQAVSEFGRLDILVNNAAMQRVHEDISEISAEEWDKTFRTNIYAQFFLCQAAVPHMKPGAAIINTTSINAKNPLPQLLAYAPAELAGAYVLLASDLGSYMTGAVIPVTGGSPML